MSSPGTGPMLMARRIEAATADPASIMALEARFAVGASSKSPLHAERMSSTRCEFCDPMVGIRTAVDDQRSEDATERIGGVNATSGLAGILAWFRDGRAGEGKARAPKQGGGEYRDALRLFEVHEIHEPAVLSYQHVVIPERQVEGVDDGVRGPREAEGQQDLHQPRALRAFTLRRSRRRLPAVPSAEARQKDREDDGEYVDGCEKQIAEQPCPDDFGPSGDRA